MRWAAIIGLALLAMGCTEVKQTTESELVPFKTVKEEDPALLKGESKVVQKGEPGIRTIVHESTYGWSGKESQKKIPEEMSLEPKNEIIKVGGRTEILLNVKSRYATLQISIEAASLFPKGYGEGRARITADAIAIKGTIKNIGARSARTETITDLGLVHPTFDNDVLIVTGKPGGLLGPGQTMSKVWAISLRRGSQKATSVDDVGKFGVTTRASIGIGNAVNGEVKSLTGLPEIN